MGIGIIFICLQPALCDSFILYKNPFLAKIQFCCQFFFVFRIVGRVVRRNSGSGVEIKKTAIGGTFSSIWKVFRYARRFERFLLAMCHKSVYVSFCVCKILEFWKFLRSPGFHPALEFPKMSIFRSFSYQLVTYKKCNMFLPYSGVRLVGDLGLRLFVCLFVCLVKQIRGGRKGNIPSYRAVHPSCFVMKPFLFIRTEKLKILLLTLAFKMEVS